MLPLMLIFASPHIVEAQLPGGLGGAGQNLQAAANAAQPGLQAAAGNALAGAQGLAASQPTTIFHYIAIPQLLDGAGKLIQHIVQKPLFQFGKKTVIDPVLKTVGLKRGTGPLEFGVPGVPGAGAPAPPGALGAAPNAAPGGQANGAANQGQPGAASGPKPAGAAGGGGESKPPDPKILASALAKKQAPANVELKIKAIRFLGKQDCICYPEVTDSLLTSLEDCSELVRYEALKALRGGCKVGTGCPHCRPVGGGLATRKTCYCQTRVIKRLSDLLLDRNAQGQLKEQSPLVRRMARLIITECLANTPTLNPQKPRPKPDPQILPTPN